MDPRPRRRAVVARRHVHFAAQSGFQSLAGERQIPAQIELEIDRERQIRPACFPVLARLPSFDDDIVAQRRTEVGLVFEMAFIGDEASVERNLPVLEPNRSGAADDEPDVRSVQHAEFFRAPGHLPRGAVSVSGCGAGRRKRSGRREAAGAADDRKLVERDRAFREPRIDPPVGEEHAVLRRLDAYRAGAHGSGYRRMRERPASDELGTRIAVDDRHRSEPRLQHLQCREVRAQRELQRRIGGKMSRRRIGNDADRELGVGVQSALRSERRGRIDRVVGEAGGKLGGAHAERTIVGADAGVASEGQIALLAAHRRRTVEPWRSGERPFAAERERRDERELDGGELRDGGERDAGECSARRDAAVVPRERIELDIAVGDMKPRLSDMHMIVRDFERRGSVEAHRPRPAILERIDDARPRPRGDACGVSRLASPAVRRRLDVEILAREGQGRLVLRERSVDARARTRKRSLPRDESRRGELDLQTVADRSARSSHRPSRRFFRRSQRLRCWRARRKNRRRAQFPLSAHRRAPGAPVRLARDSRASWR